MHRGNEFRSLCLQTVKVSTLRK